jgi:NitT/TauT family transport system substrate-binding protein
MAAMMAALPARAQEKFIFTPHWTAQAQFAGFYVAKEKGFYREAGLDVDIVHPSVSQKAIYRLQKNLSDATTLQLAEAIEMMAQGVAMVNILQTSMNNSMVIISRRGVDPYTQKGARVGIWQAGFGQLARCMCLKEGLNYEWVAFASNVNLFVKGALDATLAMSYNEYFQLLQTGMTLNEQNVYRFAEHGYNVQEDGVYVTKDFYTSHRDQARRFAEASKKGWVWAAEHPDETLDIVMRYVKRDKIATNRVLQKLMLQEVLRQQVDRESGKREFRLRPDMVTKASSLLKMANIIDRTVTYEELIAR